MESGGTAELFITATPRRSLALNAQAQELFSGLANVLRRRRARVLQERVFATPAALPAVLAARAAAYGDLDDGPAPILLAVPAGPMGAIAGVQVHAVRSGAVPQVIRLGDRPVGRAVPAAGGTYVTLSGLVAPEAGSNTAQARAIFEMAEAALRQAGGTMRSVARTWLWIEDILAWYGNFNRVRNQFFTERGLLNGNPLHNFLPASTGIGVRPAGAPHCALDVVAVVGGESAVEYFGAAGNQQNALDYGSAFSRTAQAATPAGKTVYVSGTAAIDETGKTRYLGDSSGQIALTLANVRACLRDMACTDADVVHAIAYSKTPEIEKEVLGRLGELGWPCVSVIGDICRDDLLFELEATACPGAKRL